MLRFDAPSDIGRQAGWQERKEPCSTYLFLPSFGNVQAQAAPRSRPFSGNASASKRSSTKRCLPSCLFSPFSFLAMAASAFLPSDASVTTCIVVAAVVDGWVVGPGRVQRLAVIFV